MAGRQTSACQNPSVSEILYQISHRLPSCSPLALTPIKPLNPFDVCAPNSKHRVSKSFLPPIPRKPTARNTGPAPPELMEPSPDKRALLLVAFAIRALELLSCLANEACYGPRPSAVVEQQYYAAKRQVLIALYEAMATRAQQSWVTPFPVLAEFSLSNSDYNLDRDAALAEQLDSPEFKWWYEERKANGELGLVLDTACDLLEGKGHLFHLDKRCRKGRVQRLG